MARRLKTHTFRGQRFIISVDEEIHGYCGLPDKPGDNPHELVASKHLPPTHRLETLVHESIHACFPNMREGSVEPAAHDIARFLWRLGYRAP